MKRHLLTFLCAVIAYTINAQRTAAGTATITFSNISCTDNGTRVTDLDFDWGITLDGVDRPDLPGDDGVFFNTEALSMVAMQPAFGLEATLAGDYTIYINDRFNFTCADIENQQVQSLVSQESGIVVGADRYDVRGFFGEASMIPTMDQWSLFILGMIITCLGLIYIRRSVQA